MSKILIFKSDISEFEVTITDNQWELLKRHARQAHKKVADFILDIIREYVDRKLREEN